MNSPIFIFTLVLALVTAADEDLANFIKSTQKFTLAVYQDTPEWAKSNANILLSPFAQEISLGILQTGGNGPTADEIKSSTYFPTSEEEINSMMTTVRTTFQQEITTKMFVQKNFTIQDNFKETVSKVYQTTSQTVDFVQANNTEATGIIETWLQDHTDRQFIGHFIASSFNKFDKNFIASSFVLKKDWSFGYSPKQTKKENFYGSYNVSIDMMTQEPVLYNYYESVDLDAKFVEIPFDDTDASVTIILPNQVKGISRIENDIETALTTPQWSQEFIQLSLPRFKVEAEYINFTSIMQRLGTNTIFNQNKVDLSALGGNAGELVVSKLEQNNVIQFSETGIEAISAPLSLVSLSTSRSFNINHSFIFYIKVKGVILFVGRVLNPQNYT